MNLVYLKHIPFEGLGSIRQWAESVSAALMAVRMYANDPFPPIESIDGLIIMGGPMSVHDVEIYPWLREEKRFVREVISRGKPVLGVCLGAQMIARALGAEIYPNPYKEIGWFPIVKEEKAKTHPLGAFLPDQLDVFHWHGETFEIPRGAIPLASSRACSNQGFMYEDRVIGLQFHLETTPASLQALLDNCSDELTPGQPYIQTAAQMTQNQTGFEGIHPAMDALLNRLFKFAY